MTHACSICGASAGLGLGPPMRPVLTWFCEWHWARLPETQAMIADRILALGVDNDDHQTQLEQPAC